MLASSPRYFSISDEVPDVSPSYRWADLDEVLEMLEEDRQSLSDLVSLFHERHGPIGSRRYLTIYYRNDEGKLVKDNTRNLSAYKDKTTEVVIPAEVVETWTEELGVPLSIECVLCEEASSRSFDEKDLPFCRGCRNVLVNFTRTTGRLLEGVEFDQGFGGDTPEGVSRKFWNVTAPLQDILGDRRDRVEQESASSEEDREEGGDEQSDEDDSAPTELAETVLVEDLEDKS